MTGDVSTGNHNRSLTLTIRLTSSSRFDVGSSGNITPSSTIRQVKEIISQREESGNCPVERQRLIHKGRILSDNDRTLADYDIGTSDGDASSGIVLYLVKGSGGSDGGNAPAAGSAAAPSAATTSAPAPPPLNPNASVNSNPFLNFGNSQNAANNPMASMMNMMGGPGGQPPDMATFQQQLQQNPQMMSDMLNNPMVQSLLNSPDFMSSMMENNPQMRAVMDSNPELRHALSDPEFMRRSMEMMRDPTAMQNMMRNQDLAMSQIENLPGGYSALRRMYEDVQEPMMDAMAGGGGAEGTAGGSSGNAANSDGTAGASNAAMPNPWGAPASSSTNASGTNTNQGAGGTGAAASNPLASLMGSMGQGAGGAGAGAANNPFASLMSSMGSMPGAAGGASGGAANPWANPAMGSNVPNLQATLQMMENPLMQQHMQQMMNNPEAMRMMTENNPMLQQLRASNPQAAAMMENPEVVCLFVILFEFYL